MKKMFIIVVMMLALTELRSQSLTKQFTAKEGLETAINYAHGSAIDNPVLALVATANQTINIGSIPVEIKFNMETGKSDSWIYAFYDSTSDDFYVWAVLNFKIGGFSAYQVPSSQITDQGINLDKNYTLEGINWFDSDTMAAKFRADEEFINFYNQKSPPDNFAGGIFNNSFVQYLDIGEPYWSLFVTDDHTTKTCALDVNTEIMSCNTQASVKNKAQSDNAVGVYPNPANTELSISGIDAGTVVSYEIFSETGNAVLSSSNHRGNSLDISSIPNGMYYLKVFSGTNFSIIPFSIVK